MTEEQFDELINLYLDNEIGRSDLGALKHAIKENLVRRRKFERACQLHQAARKALTAPSADKRGESRGGSAASIPGGNRPQSWRKSGSGVSPSSAPSRLSEVSHPASINALAERQAQQGAASTVDRDRVSLESRSGGRSRGRGAAPNYSFFDSPAGMLVALLLIVVGCLSLYFILRAASPVATDEQSRFDATLPSVQSGSGYDPKAAEELAAEVKKQKAAPLAADDMRSRVYQSALTGQATSDDSTVDYFSSHLDSAATGTASGNAGAGPPAPGGLNSTQEASPSASTPTDAPPQP